MKRAFQVLLLLGFFVPAALGQSCTACEQVICTKDGVDITTTQCPPAGTVAPAGKGVKSCRTVSNCGGCIGYSCIIKDPSTLSTKAVGTLVPARTTIRVIPAATIELGK